jgi:hypothetical protein
MSKHGKGERPPAAGGAREAQEGATCRPQSRQRPREGTVMVALAAMAITLVAVSTFFKLSESGQQPQAPSAAIVDQLSLTQPNPDLVQSATRTLEQAGYTVDYYPGEQVTVDFYRNLPLHDYDLIVLRAHSGVARTAGSVGLFTSEPYSPTRYLAEQRAGVFLRAHYYDGGELYFGINPRFVEASMAGRFDNTLIIMMGCWGLTRGDMAEAFVRRGAHAVVSWDGLVSAAHTDAATEQLLEHLLVDRLTVPEAVAQTMDEVGPDPTYGSSLLFYPPESVDSSLGQAHLTP